MSSNNISILIKALVDNTASGIAHLNESINKLSNNAGLAKLKLKIDIDTTQFGSITTSIEQIGTQLKTLGKGLNVDLNVNTGNLDKVITNIDAKTGDIKSKITQTTEQLGVQVALTEKLNKETGQLEATEKKVTNASEATNIKLQKRIADAKKYLETQEKTLQSKYGTFYDASGMSQAKEKLGAIDTSSIKYLYQYDAEVNKIKNNIKDLASRMKESFNLNAQQLKAELEVEERAKIEYINKYQAKIKEINTRNAQESKAELEAEERAKIEYINKYQAKIKEINTKNNQQLEEELALEQQLQKEYVNRGMAQIKEIEQRNKAELQLEQETAEIKKQVALYKQKFEIQNQNLKTQYGKAYDNEGMQNIASQVSALNPNDFKSINEMRTKFNEINLGSQQVQSNMRAVQRELALTSAKTDSFLQTLVKDFGKMVAWTIVGTALFGTLRQIKEGISYIVEMNKLFVNLQMEMTNTNLVFEDVLKTANATALAFGSTTENVMKATSVFGTYTSTIEEVNAQTQAAIILSNISSQGIETTADALMGVMSQYKMAATESMHVADIIASTARNLKVDFPKAITEISEGLRTIGSVAYESKAPIELVSAMIGTLAEKTRRSGSEVANALRTIFGRILNVGEEADPESMKKVEKQLTSIGVTIREIGDPTTLRPIGDILADLASKWGQLNDVQKQSIAFDAAGMYRKNIFMTLMSSYTDVIKNNEAAINSNGVALQKNAIFVEGIEGKINRLKTALQTMWSGIISSDFLKGVIDAGTTLINIFSSFIKTAGAVPLLIGAISIAVLTLGKNLKIIQLLSFESLFMNLPKTVANTTSAFSALISNFKYLPLAFSAAKAQGTGLAGMFRILQVSEAGAAAGATALGAALTLGLSVVITALVVVITKLATHLANYRKELQETLTTTNTQIVTIKEQIAGLQALSKEYDILKEKEKNTTITADEKERLLQIQQELVSTYDVSITGINNEGKAYSDSTLAIQLRTQALQDELQAKKDLAKETLDELDKDSVKKIKKAEDEINSLKERIESKKQYLSQLEKDPKSTKAQIKVAKGIIESLQEALQEANKDYIKVIEENTAERLKYLQDSSTQTISQLEKDGQKISSTSKALAQEFAKGLSTEAIPYEQQESTLKNFINGVLPQLDSLMAKYEEFKKAKNVQGMNETSEAIKKMLNNLGTNFKGMESAGLKIQQAFPKVGFWDLFKTAVGGVTEEVKDTTTILEEQNKVIDDMQSSLSSLAGAYEKVAGGQKLTSNELLDLLQQYPKMINYLDSEGNLIVTQQGLLEALFEMKKNEAKQSIQFEIDKADATIKSLQLQGQAYDAFYAAILPVEAYRRLTETDISTENYAKLQEASKKVLDLKSKMALIDKLSIKDFSPPKTGGAKGSVGSQYTPISDDAYAVEQGRYTALNKSLDEINISLEKNATLQEQSSGQKRLNAISEEIKLLQQKKKAIENINKEQEEEKKDLRKTLEEGGVGFDQKGVASFESYEVIKNTYKRAIDELSKQISEAPTETKAQREAKLFLENQKNLLESQMNNLHDAYERYNTIYKDIGQSEIDISKTNGEVLDAQYKKSQQRFDDLSILYEKGSIDAKTYVEKLRKLLVSPDYKLSQEQKDNIIKSISGTMDDTLKAMKESYEAGITSGTQYLSSLIALKDGAELTAEQFREVTKSIKEMGEAINKAKETFNDAQEELSKYLSDTILEAQKNLVELNKELAEELPKSIIEGIEKTQKAEAQTYEKWKHEQQEKIDKREEEIKLITEKYETETTLYDKSIKDLQAEIDAKQEANDKIQEGIDLSNQEKNLAEAKERLANAQAERNTKVYRASANGGKGGFVWEQNPKELKEAKDNLIKVQNDYDTFMRQREIRLLQDKIEVLTKQKDLEIKAIKDKAEVEAKALAEKLGLNKKEIASMEDVIAAYDKLYEDKKFHQDEDKQAQQDLIDAAEEQYKKEKDLLEGSLSEKIALEKKKIEDFLKLQNTDLTNFNTWKDLKVKGYGELITKIEALQAAQKALDLLMNPPTGSGTTTPPATTPESPVLIAPIPLPPAPAFDPNVDYVALITQAVAIKSSDQVIQTLARQYDAQIASDPIKYKDFENSTTLLVRLGYYTFQNTTPTTPAPVAPDAPSTSPAFAANGTDFSQGGLTVVGEKGAELVNLPKGAQVFPNGIYKKFINVVDMIGTGRIPNFGRKEDTTCDNKVINNYNVDIREVKTNDARGFINSLKQLAGSSI